jgi:ribonuclease BN (tRNA processing enzyme)
MARSSSSTAAGAARLGAALMARGKAPIRADILLGHTHWDHIQGFPFFTPAFVPGNSVAIHGPDGSRGSLHHVLQGQMEYTYFPIELGQLAAAISYHDLNEGIHTIGGARVATQYLNHPATTLGYRVEADGVAVVYLVDHEPFADSLWRAGAEPGRIESILHDGDRRHAQFMAGADLVIHDAQYTPEEYPAKKTWGHSTYEYVVQICAAAGVRRVAHPPRSAHGDRVARSSARPRPASRAARSSTSLLPSYEVR